MKNGCSALDSETTEIGQPQYFAELIRTRASERSDARIREHIRITYRLRSFRACRPGYFGRYRRPHLVSATLLNRMSTSTLSTNCEAVSQSMERGR